MANRAKPPPSLQPSEWRRLSRRILWLVSALGLLLASPVAWFVWARSTYTIDIDPRGGSTLLLLLLPLVAAIGAWTCHSLRLEKAAVILAAFGLVWALVTMVRVAGRVEFS
jgi:hypothetical protein